MLKFYFKHNSEQKSWNSDQESSNKRIKLMSNGEYPSRKPPHYSTYLKQDITVIPLSVEMSREIRHVHSVPFSFEIRHFHSKPFSYEIRDFHSKPFSFEIRHFHSKPFSFEIRHFQSVPFCLEIRHFHSFLSVLWFDISTHSFLYWESTFPLTTFLF